MTTAARAIAQFTVFTVACGVLCATAEAAKIKVSNGDDLQAAIDGAADGDTILVGKGDYGPISLQGRAGLTIKGKGKPRIDASAANSGIALDSCQRISISGFVVHDSQLSGIYGDQCEDVTIRKCLVMDAGDEGIDFESCERITIDRNTVDTTDDDGIAVADSSSSESNNCIITRNRIFNVPDGGIDIHGDNNLISGNLVAKSKEWGVLIASGSGNRVERNKFIKIEGHGIELEGDATTVSNNKISGPTANGILVSGGSHTITGNKIAKAGESGVRVETDGNEVTKNKAKKSGGADLQDTTGGDGNTYTGNKAKELDPPELPNPKR